MELCFSTGGMRAGWAIYVPDGSGAAAAYLYTNHVLAEMSTTGQCRCKRPGDNAGKGGRDKPAIVIVHPVAPVAPFVPVARKFLPIVHYEWHLKRCGTEAVTDGCCGGVSLQKS